ncbi:MAG: DUF2306 domain-containing protein [Cyclobacteriaceae bacterium]|nr:DUF2306 domain-containing protein [Cyclobacteriaceae bacterium]
MRYVWEGMPPDYNRINTLDIVWFVSHIITGTLIVALATLQFNKNFRNRNIATHRLFGKLYVFYSIISVLILWFDIIPRGDACCAVLPKQ